MMSAPDSTMPSTPAETFARAFGLASDYRSQQSPIEIQNMDRSDLATVFQVMGYTVGAEI